MPLTLHDVHAIAHLARLDLAADESQSMLAQLNDFFAIVERMSTVDTAGIEPLYTPLSAVRDVRLRLRDDVVTEENRRDENLRNAPAVDDGLFLVPKVIE
jgi:aspartyl-tRNA(Asn)/glutamyl-tRNA(Gln) amidotransferase subunit C